MTEWRRIPHLPERFQASDDGRIRTISYVREYVDRNDVKRVKEFPERVLTQSLRNPSSHHAEPHPYVLITKGTSRANKRSRPYRVSLLVAAAFHGMPYDRTDQSQVQSWRIRHIDGDVTNTRSDNLRWYRRGSEFSNVDHWNAVKGTLPVWLLEMYKEEAA